MVKYKTSIALFLLLSTGYSVYIYVYNRTDRNILKSLEFTLYFLAIKIGFIAYKIPLELKQNQSANKTLISIEQVRPVYNPYVSVFYESRSYVLEMENIQHSILTASLETRSTINDIRAGDLKSNVREAAWLFVTIWMIQQQGNTAFQPVRQAPQPPPHQQLFGGVSSSPRNNNFSKCNPTTTAVSGKPADMSHEKFVNLSKEQKRNLPDPRDAFICEEGRPTLVVRFGQAKYKTPQHGGLFGLPKNEKGKVPRGDENAFVFRDGVVALANSKDVKRYDNGM